MLTLDPALPAAMPRLGFADPNETDFDSTVQEANIAYPADANLMIKLVGLGKKVVDYLKERNAKTELGKVQTAIRSLHRKLAQLEKRKAELLAMLDA